MYPFIDVYRVIIPFTVMYGVLYGSNTGGILPSNHTRSATVLYGALYGSFTGAILPSNHTRSATVLYGALYGSYTGAILPSNHTRNANNHNLMDCVSL